MTRTSDRSHVELGERRPRRALRDRARSRRWRLALAAATLALATACSPSEKTPAQLVEQARGEMARGAAEAAVKDLATAAGLAPTDAEIQFQVGRAYTDVGAGKVAEIYLQKARELKHDPSKVVPALGGALLVSRQYQRLLDEIDPAAVGEPAARAQILVLRAQALSRLGRGAEARKSLALALEAVPDFADALIASAELEMREGAADAARGLVERAVATSPRNVDAWLAKGDVERALGRDAAADAYAKAVGIDPKNLRARSSLAWMQVTAGKYDEARATIDQVKTIPGGDLLARYFGALIAFRKGDVPAARAAVLAALTVGPNHVASLLLASSVEHALGHDTEANAYLARVLKIHPDDVAVRKALVTSLARSGQIDAAREALEPALAQAPDDVALLTLAGELALNGNDLEGAFDYFRRAAKIDPKRPGPRAGLGLSRLAAGESERALADLQAAASLDSRQYQADVLLVAANLKRGAYDQALKAAEALERKLPDSPLTHNLKGLARLGRRDSTGARADFERALAIAPDYLPAAVNLARLDVAEQHPAAARARLESMLGRRDKTVDVLIALSELGGSFGATRQERVDWLNRARAQAPDSLKPLLLLAKLYADGGDAAKALDLMTLAQAKDPNNLRLLAGLGLAQSAAGRTREAVDTYARLVALQPKSPQALLALANAQLAAGDTINSMTTLERAIAVDPDYHDALVARTRLQIRTGLYKDAVKSARQLQQRERRSPVGYELEGDVMLADKKYLEAVRLYETAEAMQRSRQLVIKQHAALTMAGRPDEADARLSRWLKAAPNDWVARVYAADAAHRAGNVAKVIQLCEELLRIRPNDAIVLNNLAVAYRETGNPRALQAAERAYELKPDNPEFADTLGWILVERGDPARAVDLLRKAATGAPKSPSIAYHFAQALANAGKPEVARKEAQRALSMDVEFPEKAATTKLLAQLRQ